MERKEFLKQLGVGAVTLPLFITCREDETGFANIGNTNGLNSSDTSADCILTNSETAGPFPTKNPDSLNRVDIRGDRTGIVMDIEITVLDQKSGCLPLEGAYVDIWHCDSDGNYSEYGGTGMQPANYTSNHFLRGRQITDSNGKVAFTSIFPGLYNGRSTHIHVHIFDKNGSSLLVSQIAFPEGENSAVNQVNAASSYGYTKGMSGYTYNSRDNVFSDGVSNELANISGSISEGYRLTHSIVTS